MRRSAARERGGHALATCSTTVEQEPQPAGIRDDQHRVYENERTEIALQAGPREDEPRYEREEHPAHQARYPGRPIGAPKVDHRVTAQAGVSHVLSPPVPANEAARRLKFWCEKRRVRNPNRVHSTYD